MILIKVAGILIGSLFLSFFVTYLYWSSLYDISETETTRGTQRAIRRSMKDNMGGIFTGCDDIVKEWIKTNPVKEIKTDEKNLSQEEKEALQLTSDDALFTPKGLSQQSGTPSGNPSGTPSGNQTQRTVYDKKCKSIEKKSTCNNAISKEDKYCEWLEGLKKCQNKSGSGNQTQSGQREIAKCANIKEENDCNNSNNQDGTNCNWTKNGCKKEKFSRKTLYI